MKYVLGLLCGVLLVFLIVIVVALTGAYNVAATEPHWGVTQALFGRLQEASIRSRARGIEVPAFDSAMIEHGFDHFDAMCVVCHGAPGVEPDEIGRGMNPEPPDLAEKIEEGEWSEAELFWITKHGIRLAGMPAFGPTHTDEELWGIVGFMLRLPDITPEEYVAMREAAAADPERGHTHADGTYHEH